jgi:hypothetical protein
MTAIFLSHSSKDNTAAGELKSWLEVEPRNHSVFLDFDPEAGIKGGRTGSKPSTSACGPAVS